jgi:catalase-peroxidase
MGNPIPTESAIQVREVFKRMTLNDAETVALIGGGHAFGKAHGACPLGAGPSPKEDPANPWPGLCGTGKGKDTYTSGLEGYWSSTPTVWSNEYFTNLLSVGWELTIGPGGAHQWKNLNKPNIMMFTSVFIVLVALHIQNILNLNTQIGYCTYQ